MKKCNADCPDRKPACHDTCLVHQARKDKNKLIADKRREYNEMQGYYSDTFYRLKKQRHIHGV